jgi:hypothetical protein
MPDGWWEGYARGLRAGAVAAELIAHGHAETDKSADAVVALTVLSRILREWSDDVQHGRTDD